MWLIFIIAAIVTIRQIVKEKKTTVIPSENWGTGKAYGDDILNGVSHEERMRRLVSGYYRGR